MASAEYIAAAKKENRKPTVLLSIEDAAASTIYYTTKSQWDGSTTLTQIDTSEVVGDASHQLNEESWTWVNNAGSVARDMLKWTASFDSRLINLTLQFVRVIALVGVTEVTIRFSVYADSSGSPGTLLFKSEYATVPVVDIGPREGAQGYRGTATVPVTASTLLTSGTTYWVGIDFPGDGSAFDDIENATTVNKIKVVTPTAQVVTSTIDMGAVPSAAPVLNIDDVIEANSSITYSAVGGNTDPPTNSLGTVADGDSLTAYRYYRITADYTSTGGRAKIREFSLTEGLFRYYGTHQDQPFSGIYPYIVQDSVGSLKSEIDLKKGLATSGEISLRLIQTTETNDLVATNFLKGKDVQVSAGFVGLDTGSYEPVITGSIQDVSIDPNRKEITLKIRSIFKQFEKRKIPEVEYDANGDISSPATDLTYTTTSLVTVMKDLFDKVGIRARYISSDFDTLESGDFSGNDWKVSRTIPREKPVEAFKLLDQLAQTGGMWFVTLGSGVIKPKVYDRNEVATYTLDANEMEYGKLDILYKDFYSRFLAYYNPKATPAISAAPSQADDYENAKFLYNATAETQFSPEKGQKEHFDQWLVGRTTASTALTAPPTALTNLVDRWDGWYADPLYTFQGRNLPPRHASIEPGDVVTVNNLPLPVPNSGDDWDNSVTYDKGDRVTHEGNVYLSLQGSNLNKEPEPNPDYWVDLQIDYEDTNQGRIGYTNGMRFLIMSKTFNPNKATIDFKFLQMPHAELGAFSADEYSTAFDI